MEITNNPPKNKILGAVKNVVSNTFFKNHKIWSTIIIIAIIIGGYFSYTSIFTSGTTTQYTFGRVTRGNLVISVSGSGQVSTLSKVSIEPNTTGQTQTLGQIISVKVQNGDNVKAGQVVAILDGKNALQTLNQAESSVTSAQASYDKLTGGLTDSQLLSLNNTLSSAQTSLNNSKQNILIALRNAYSSAANVVYQNTDSFFTNPTRNNPQISIDAVSFTNQTLQNSIDQERYNIQSVLDNWGARVKSQDILTAASTTDDYIVGSINQTLTDLNSMRNYFDDMTTLFTLYGVGSNSTAIAAINSDKGTASSARGSIDSLISSFVSSLQSYNGLITQLKQDQESASIQQEPPSADDLAVSMASLDNAKANLANAEQAYASRIITAPFDGQIGGLTASVGQQVSSSDSLGTLITAEKVINVTLNEIDAAKVSAGNAVSITFDSLPNLTITGKVSYIDPLGTVTQGVVSYDVQISMDEQNDQIKTGMTATVAITVTEHSDTLVIPTSAITTTAGKKYVLVADISSSTLQGQFGNFGGATSTRNFGTSTGQNFASSTFVSGNFASTTRASSSRQFGSSSSSSRSSASITTQYPVSTVEITTGISNGISTEVLSGLTEGQLVVTKKSTVSSTATKTAASTATTNARGGFGIGGGGFGGGAVGAFSGSRGN